MCLWSEFFLCKVTASIMSPPIHFKIKFMFKTLPLPGFGRYSSWVFTTIPFYTLKLTNMEANEIYLKNEVQALVDDLKKTQEEIRKFHEFIPFWQKIRLETLQQTAIFHTDDLHETQKKFDITKVASSSVGIVAGGVAMTGAFLAPYTLGASLGLLSIGGITVGVAASGTGIGAAVVKAVKENKKQNEFEEICKADMVLTKKLLDYTENIEQLHQNIKKRIKEIKANDAALHVLHLDGRRDVRKEVDTQVGVLKVISVILWLPVKDMA